MKKSGKIVNESVRRAIQQANVSDINSQADKTIDLNYVKVINNIIKTFGKSYGSNWWSLDPGTKNPSDNYSDFYLIRNPQKNTYHLSEDDIDSLDSLFHGIKDEIAEINAKSKRLKESKYDGLCILGNLQVDGEFHQVRSEHEFQMKLYIVKPNQRGNFTGDRRYASLSQTFIFSDYYIPDFSICKSFLVNIINFLRATYHITDEMYDKLLQDDELTESVNMNIKKVKTPDMSKAADKDLFDFDNPESFLKFVNNMYKSQISDDFSKFSQLEEYKMRYPDQDEKSYKLFMYVYTYSNSKFYNQEKDVFLVVKCDTKSDGLSITFEYEDSWARNGLAPRGKRLYTQPIQSGLSWDVKKGFSGKNAAFIISIAKNIIDNESMLKMMNKKWDDVSRDPYQSLTLLFCTTVWNEIVWKLSIMNESVNKGISSASKKIIDKNADTFIPDDVKNRQFYTPFHNELSTFIKNIKGYTRKKVSKYPFEPEFKDGGYSNKSIFYKVDKTCTCKFDERHINEFDYEGKHYVCKTDWTKLMFSFSIFQRDIEYFEPDETDGALNTKHGILSNSFYIYMAPQQFPSNFIFWKSIDFVGDDFKYTENYENKTWRQQPNVNDELIHNYEKFIFALKETVSSLPPECFRRVGNMARNFTPASGEACCEVDGDAIIDILNQYNFDNKLHINFKKLP